MSAKKTHEQFLQEMEERGNPNVVILGKYQTTMTPIKCTCKKHPNTVWETAPLNLLHGTGCPECAKEKGKELRKTNEEFLQRMKETGNPNVIVLEEYKGNRIKLKCQCKKNSSHIWYATPANLQKGRGCPLCRNEKVGKMFSIDEKEFLYRFNKTGHPDELEILGKYERSDKEIQVKCKKDPRHLFKIKPYFLIQGCHCPYCTGRRVNETNSLNSLRPDLTLFLKNKSDGDRVTLSSDEILDVKCPNCGYEKKTQTKTLVRGGFSCPICGDGISFPNKFIRNMLTMLGVDFVPEWSPEWAGRRRYDVMFMYNNQPVIVEMDGSFHQRESPYKTLEKNQKSDKEKEELAKKNGCKLIRINCDQSHGKAIFNNILKSELAEMFDLRNFDRIECEIRSVKSLLVQVCKYYNEHPTATTKEMASLFQIGTPVILKYLRKGKELGICTVPVKEKQKQRKSIKVIQTFSKVEKSYKSIADLLRSFENDFDETISENTLYRATHPKNETGIYHWRNFEFILED